MKKINVTATLSALLLTLAVILPLSSAFGQSTRSQPSEIDSINVASAAFIAGIAARDIHAIEMLWVHEPHVTFIGPLSTSVVVGWRGVRQAWEMRFAQFDRVTISLQESHVHTNGKLAWAVGIEKVQLLRKDGRTLSFDAFVTNVFENRDGHWLIVSHHATPMFKGAE
jgi:ketosteroid isomerase-like protein